MSSTELFDAASISMTSSDVALAIETHESQTPHGSIVGPVLAVQAGREDLRHRRLAGPARADEQVGVVDLVLRRRRCAACARRAPGRRRRRTCAGGGGGRARGRRTRATESSEAGRRTRSLGSRAVRTARAIGFSALLGLVAWAIVGRGLVNYDTLYTLVWGRELAHGRSPTSTVPIAPTPHPLATSARRARSARWATARRPPRVIVALLLPGALGWVVFALGREWFNTAAGVLAAAIVLTRVPVLDFGARAYVDIPYLVLVLGALLVETRRPRAGAPVLALLALAGLLRPEAWLFSAAYLVLAVARRRARRAPARARRRRPAAVVPARPPADRRPAALADRHARQRRDAAARDRAAARAAHDAAPARRDPARAGAAGARRAAACCRCGAATGARGSAPRPASSRWPRSACWRRPGCRSSRATCCCPPPSWRSSAAPACSAGSTCPRAIRGGGAGRPSARSSWCCARLRAQPGGAHRPARRRPRAPGPDPGRPRTRSRPRCAARRSRSPTTARSRCSPCGSRSPQAVVDAQDTPLRSGTYVAPANAAVAKDYILDPRDLDQAIPPAPAAFRPVAANRSWRVAAHC